MTQTFLIVLKPNEGEEPWTPESIEECFLNTTESQTVGVEEVVADDFSGGWADAMLRVNAKIDNLGDPLPEPEPPVTPPETIDLNSRDDLIQSRDYGGMIYIGAWVRLMAMELGVKMPEQGSTDYQEMVAQMHRPFNLGTELGWGIALGHRDTVERALKELKECAAEVIGDEDDGEPLEESLRGMTQIGALGVTGWTEKGGTAVPQYANTAYAVRGFRFAWPHVRVMALIGQMEPVIEGDHACDHDPSVWGSTPGAIECAKGCGAMWSAELAATPDPFEEKV